MCTQKTRLSSCEICAGRLAVKAVERIITGVCEKELGDLRGICCNVVVLEYLC